jgi:L-threonylcarbamoyladenylate synthase
VSTVPETAAAVEAGELAVIPTDTVYGLACRPDREESVRALSALKRRSPDQPIALVASGAEALRTLIPELAATPLVTGPFTLVVPNPARRLPWLGGAESVGVRIPEVDGLAAELFARVAVVAATSANLHGGADPARVEDVPTEILDGVAAVLDVGALPGTPSTVVDLTGAEPRVVREGVVPAAEALRRVGQ